MDTRADNTLRVYIGDDYLQLIDQWAIENDVIATTGRKTGQPNRSEVIRLALDALIRPANSDLSLADTSR